MKKGFGTLSGAGAGTILAVLSFLAPTHLVSAALNSARVTQVIQDVKLLPSNATPKPAAVNDDVREGTAVRTGQDSRTELTFEDKTLTRLGSNSVFSFNTGTRTFDLGQGAVLMTVPPNGSTVKVKTAAVTAAITGGTALFGNGPPAKFMVLEGTGTFYPNGHPEEAITLHPGEMLTWVDGHLVGPATFDVKTVMETSELIVDFPDLANLPLILTVIGEQQGLTFAEPTPRPKDPNDTVDQADNSRPGDQGPPTTGTGKFGSPSAISSPNPYQITSGTSIQTDPTITTNGVTDNGKIYRNPTDDGPRATWMFGSTSTFDTTSGFASGPDSGNMNNMAVFKFTSLQITGNPTVNVPSAGDPSNLGLIGVNGITTGGPGGVLTFDNVSMLLLATQNGSINLGSEVSFSGVDRMHIYARGTGSNLTIGSAISTNNDLRLYSEGTVQLNGTANTINFSSFSGGDWLNGSGVINANGIYITSLGNITLDGGDLPDLFDGGGDISLHAANTLTVNVTGGTNTRENFSLQGMTVNLVSDTPVVLDLSAINPSVTAGTGGIQGSNVGLIGDYMTLDSGGDINLYSIGVHNSTLTGSVTAAGALNVTSNVETGSVTTGTSVTVGGDLFADVDAGTTIDVTGHLQGFQVTAGGNITAGRLRVLNIDAPTGILTVSDNIIPLYFLPGGENPQHTFNVSSIVAPGGIDFSGFNYYYSGLSEGGKLTINATTIAFDAATGIGSANFNGADAGTLDGGAPAEGGSGGTFIVNTTGNITTVLGADITATTGLNESGDHGFHGNGGNVTLNSTAGTVTVDSLIQVSSNDGVSEGGEPIRRSASGGNITLHSGLATGLGVSIGGNAQLLSLLNHNAPGPGGTILITTAGADIHMGEFSGAVLEADFGTIDVHQTAAGTGGTSLIEIYNTALSAETISIASSGDFELGVEGLVIVDGVTLSLTAAHDLTMDGFTDDRTAVHSDGNVTISAGNNLSILSDLDITRTNSGRLNGVNLTLSAGNNFSFGNAISLRSVSGGQTTGGNVSILAGTDLAGGSITGTGSNKNITEAANVEDDLGTGGNVKLHASGSITADKVDLSVTLHQDTALTSAFDLTGPVLGTGGNIDILAGGAFTLVANSTSGSGLSAIVNTGTEGTITTGGVIQLNVGGDYSVVGPSLFQIQNTDGEVGTGGNISIFVTNGLTATGGLEADVLTSGDGGGVVGTGGNIDFTVFGNVSTPHLTQGDFTSQGQLILYVDASNGGSIDTGGDINLNIHGTTALDGPLVMEVDSFAGGNITTGGNITGHFFGDVTNTTGPQHSLNFFVVNGGNIFFGPLDGGTIGTGGNIDVTFDGNINTTPSGTMGSFAAEIGNANGGTIGTGGNIAVKIGTALNPLSGNLNVAGLFVYTTNTNGGTITDGGNITFDAKGAVTTTQQAVFELLNSGGTIGSDPVVYVHAASFNIGGLLLADIDNTNGNIGEEGSGSLSLHSDGAITVAQGLWVNGAVTAGGDVTAYTIASTDITVTSATGSINALAGGITRFRHLDGDNSTADVLHTLTAFKVTSDGGINFNGINADGDFSHSTDAGQLTINASSLSFGNVAFLTNQTNAFTPPDISGSVTFNGGDGSSTFDPGNGGTFTVNTTGTIEVNSDIEATSGRVAAPSATPAGFGGTVTLNSTGDTVTVNNRIEVSSNDPDPEISPAPPLRRSNAGGNITITSAKTGGEAINIGSSAQLLSRLNFDASGPGGTIEISATGNGSTINIDNSGGLSSPDDWSIQADGGTIDINNHGNSSFINISNADMHADVIKAEIFGTGGTLTIGGGSIDASSALTMYAASSNGSIIFNADVTLNSGATAAIIAANTVTINNGVTVTIGGSVAAQVYANVRNYDIASGGAGGSFGSFAGAGATSQPFDSNNPPVVANAGTVGSQSATSGSVALTAASQAKNGGQVTLAQSSALKTSLITKPITSRMAALPSHPHQLASKPMLNVANSSELLAQLESATESGGKINVVAKSQPRNRLQTSTRRGNVVRNGNVPAPAVTNVTSTALTTKGPMAETAPVTTASVRTLSY
jgi:FecR-like protein